MELHIRQRTLILCAAVGSIALRIAYQLAHEYWPMSVLLWRLDLLVLIATLLGGALCAYLGLPARCSFRSTVTVIYLICATGPPGFGRRLRMWAESQVWWVWC
jgi:hypothetical protein